MKKKLKPYSYIFKYYAIAYLFLLVIIIYMNYENWIK